MALVNNHVLTERQLDCYSPSVGSSPTTAYVRVPFRCKVLKVGAVLYGTLTGDATVATTIAGTAITGGSITLTASGSTGGSTFSATPTGAYYANEDDYISFPSSSGTGSNIAAQYFVVVQEV
jgi:hypothetical protein